MSLNDGLVFKKLSEKKQQKKKKPKFKVPSTVVKQHYQSEETSQTPTNDDRSFSDDLNDLDESKLIQVNFELNVSQPLSLFFNPIDTKVIFLSGSKNYDEQYRHLMNSSHTQVRVLKKFKSATDMLEKCLEFPRFDIENYSQKKSFSFVQQQLLNRSDHLSCMSSDNRFLYICGGRSGNIMHHDFISYDIESNIMYVYENLHLASHAPNNFYENINLPSLCGHGMIEHCGEIYIFGSGEECPTVHLVGAVGEPLRLTYLEPLNWFSFNPLFSNRSYFTMTKSSSEESKLDIYVFGGKPDKGPFDETMYLIQFPKQYYYNRPMSCIPIKAKNIDRLEGRWPVGRYGHSACKVANSIFIYGGRGCGDELLNDLFMFDISSKKWTEIIAQSMIPPPLFKHQSFSVDEQSFYIYGGSLAREVSHSLFKFNIATNKWNLIEIVSDEIKQTISGHQCLVSNSGEVFVIGSFGSQDKKKHSFTKLLHAGENVKSVSNLQYLEEKRMEGFLCDVAFKVKESLILAHKCILKVRCPSLYNMVQSCTETISRNEVNGTFLDCELLTLVNISDCDPAVLDKYLKYLYTGSVNLSGSEQIEFLKFVKRISEIKHFPTVRKICSPDWKSIEISKQVFNTIQDDLASLLGDSMHSDITLVLGESKTSTVQQCKNEITQIQDGIHAHRLFLSRSPFFSKMLVTSGMLETKEKIVHLTDYSREVMLPLLKYLYTDVLQLTSSNSLGLLVYSLLFDLEDVASCCRRMVISLLDISTIFPVYEIATFHNDRILENACENFMIDNYGTLSKVSTFLKIVPEKTRMHVQEHYERKSKRKN